MPTTSGEGRISRCRCWNWLRTSSGSREKSSTMFMPRRAPRHHAAPSARGDRRCAARAGHRRQQRHFLGGRCRVAQAAALSGRGSTRGDLRSQRQPARPDEPPRTGATRGMEPDEPGVRGSRGQLFREYDRHIGPAAGARGGNADFASLLLGARHAPGARAHAHVCGGSVRRPGGGRRQRRILARAIERRPERRRPLADAWRREPRDRRRDAGIIPLSIDDD